jgi:monoamine oxidase
MEKDSAGANNGLSNSAQYCLGTHKSDPSRARIAIIGGGLGGLMTAYLLDRGAPGACRITIFEAGSRLGGKAVTGQFQSAPVIYEAGVAELYDYSQLGADPLREMIAEFGLPSRSLSGTAVVIDDQILKSHADIRRQLGSAAAQALKHFNTVVRKAISASDYYQSDWQADGDDPMSQQSFRDMLAALGNDSARHYIEVSVHSDLATEPHLTNAKYGLHNYLMNENDYMRLYTIEGGIERLPRALSERISARVLLDRRVTRVKRMPGGLYRVTSRGRGEVFNDEFGYVIAALPNNWLPLIDWGGAGLANAMHRHHAFYDYPAHYLRVSVLFSEPFWRKQIDDSYFILDAFGGCCVYDKGPRGAGGSYGVLGWLLAGEAALSMSSLDDAALIEAVLDALPASLRNGRKYRLEGRVHRWLGTVNGLPGGVPVRDPDHCHRPEPNQHPELFVVGDYLFDSTINGVLDSAGLVAESIIESLAGGAGAAVSEVAAQTSHLTAPAGEWSPVNPPRVASRR